MDEQVIITNNTGEAVSCHWFNTRLYEAVDLSKITHESVLRITGRFEVSVSTHGKAYLDNPIFKVVGRSANEVRFLYSELCHRGQYDPEHEYPMTFQYNLQPTPIFTRHAYVVAQTIRNGYDVGFGLKGDLWSILEIPDGTQFILTY